MIQYRVTIHIDKNRESEWLDWMQAVHIPDVMKTGLFSKCSIWTSVENYIPEKSTYHFDYTCASQENLEIYLQEHAPSLREDHTSRFAGFFQAEREINRLIR